VEITGETDADSATFTTWTDAAGELTIGWPAAWPRVGSAHSGAWKTTFPRSAAGAIPPWPPSGRALSPIVRRSAGESPWITTSAVQGKPPGESGSICRTISLGPGSSECFFDLRNGGPVTDTLHRCGRTTRRRISSFRPVGSEPRSMSSAGNDQVHIGGGFFPVEFIDQGCNRKTSTISNSRIRSFWPRKTIVEKHSVWERSHPARFWRSRCHRPGWPLSAPPNSYSRIPFPHPDGKWNVPKSRD